MIERPMQHATWPDTTFEGERVFLLVVHQTGFGNPEQNALDS